MGNMKSLVVPFAVTCFLLGGHRDAGAQAPGDFASAGSLSRRAPGYTMRPRYTAWPYPLWSRAGTPAEAYARGVAAVTIARGHFLRLAAEARAIHAEARAREIRNRREAIHACFALREGNRQARAAQRTPRTTASDLVRYAQMGKPRRLSPSELDTSSGQIHWPGVLGQQRFDPARDALEQAFARGAARGELRPTERERARQAAETMLAQLKGQIRRLDPADYLSARNFLESLLLELQPRRG